MSAAPAQSTPTPGPKPSTIREAARSVPAFCVYVLFITASIVDLSTQAASDTVKLVLALCALVIVICVVFIIVYLAVWHPELWGPGGQPPAPVIEGSDVIEQVKKPSILCISTPDFDPKRFEQGTAIVEQTMGKKIRSHKRLIIEKAADFSAWRRAMLQGPYDIVHISVHVDPNDGSLDLGDGKRITAVEFRTLMVEAKAHLVVLATCDSVALGAVVSRATNMIASLTLLRFDDFLTWADTFYTKIAQGAPLSRAYDVASAMGGTRMVLLLKKDVVFV